MDNIQAVIFDLDGTLIDSMGIWAQIDEEYLSKFGYNVPDNLQEKITHLTLTETAIYFKNNFNIDSSIEDIISTWHE
ncbi:HAD hydrolase-like protein, partial [Clostridium perfringens]